MRKMMVSTGFNPFARHTESQPSKPNGQGENASTPEPQTATAGNAAETEERPPRPAEEKPAPAARANKAINPFASHASEKRPLIRLNRTHEVPPAQRLMAWLPRWPKATISVREIRVYGPNSLRDPKIAADAIEVLAGYGWLVPVMAPAYNQKWWEIVRAPEQPVATT
jgi:hypothetical protein